MWKKTGIGAATLFAAIALAAPAHADDHSYIEYIRSHGQPVPQYAANDWVMAGYTACGHLRDGETPAQAASHSLHPFRTNGRIVVEAAQHELCPDQL